MAKKSKEETAKGQFWQQNDKLNNGNYEMPDDAWITTTASLAKIYFGENSDAYVSARDFDKKPSIYMLDEESIRAHYAARKARAGSMIKGFVELVGHQGLYKPAKKNFLNYMDQKALIALIALIGGAIFFAGKFEEKLQHSDDKQILKEQSDSLKLYRHSIDSLSANSALNKFDTATLINKSRLPLKK